MSWSLFRNALKNSGIDILYFSQYFNISNLQNSTFFVIVKWNLAREHQFTRLPRFESIWRFVKILSSKISQKISTISWVQIFFKIIPYHQESIFPVFKSRLAPKNRLFNGTICAESRNLSWSILNSVLSYWNSKNLSGLLRIP